MHIYVDIACIKSILVKYWFSNFHPKKGNIFFMFFTCKNLKQSLLFFLLCSNVVPVHAVSPDAPQKCLKNFLIMAVAGPIFLASLEAISPRNEFPKACLWFTIGNAIYWSLVYRIVQKYTPQAKYAWALRVKNLVEKNPLLVSRDVIKDIKAECNQPRSLIMRFIRVIDNFIKRKTPPFMDAVKQLYMRFRTLEYAYKCILGAPEDMPDDLLFKKECEELAEKIKHLQSQVEKCAKVIVNTKEWDAEFVELIGFDPSIEFGEGFFGSRSVRLQIEILELKSLKWSVNLGGRYRMGSWTQTFLY